jgi:hypothetical protein
MSAASPNPKRTRYRLLMRRSDDPELNAEIGRESSHYHRFLFRSAAKKGAVEVHCRWSNSRLKRRDRRGIRAAEALHPLH